ncbi:MarR family winged helix-turn-helix transcriptional regulator [Aliiroseovarius lamellibrachiae]|uniref:MarR family winged helix-turn-helix transcriptional regulator n=1 Tax=Aliiroseovarius lamellibrachiae TaxID=1924933 RepID=UPI001BE0962B|nr:MarR family winged helix-turn-helix transcriptional regulator [Aliiroseovarius lamellibrachiae]
MTAFKLNDFLPYQIAVLSSRISAEFSKHYRDAYGITVSEWRVVAHLSQANSVSVREIHKRVDMDKPKVSRAASRLEGAGFITKTVNPHDRRLVELELTEKGREMIDALAPIARSYQEELETLMQNPKDFRQQIDLLIDALGNGRTSDD